MNPYDPPKPKPHNRDDPLSVDRPMDFVRLMLTRQSPIGYVIAFWLVTVGFVAVTLYLFAYLKIDRWIDPWLEQWMGLSQWMGS